MKKIDNDIINRALIRELNSKILSENGRIQNAKFKLRDLNKQLDQLKRGE